MIPVQRPNTIIPNFNRNGMCYFFLTYSVNSLSTSLDGSIDAVSFPSLAIDLSPMELSSFLGDVIGVYVGSLEATTGTSFFFLMMMKMMAKMRAATRRITMMTVKMVAPVDIPVERRMEGSM